MSGFRHHPLLRRVARRLACGLLLCVAAVGCEDSTGFQIVIDLAGTVRNADGPVPGARVILRDQRTLSETGEILGTATATAAGTYTLRARAQRSGYEQSCEFLVLYVEGFRNSTELSTPLACSNVRQNIDLLVTEDVVNPGRDVDIARPRS